MLNHSLCISLCSLLFASCFWVVSLSCRRRLGTSYLNPIWQRLSIIQSPTTVCPPNLFLLSHTPRVCLSCLTRAL
ncbi:hypothetical protein BJ165DRAFT_1484927, partial [Panaeolus papilionaceus]